MRVACAFKAEVRCLILIFELAIGPQGSCLADKGIIGMSLRDAAGTADVPEFSFPVLKQPSQDARKVERRPPGAAVATLYRVWRTNFHSGSHASSNTCLDSLPLLPPCVWRLQLPLTAFSTVTDKSSASEHVEPVSLCPAWARGQHRPWATDATADAQDGPPCMDCPALMTTPAPPPPPQPPPRAHRHSAPRLDAAASRQPHGAPAAHTQVALSEKAPRSKVALEKGYSQVDWLRLSTSGADLAGLGGSGVRKDVTLDEVRQHKALPDPWIVLRGKVYNIGAAAQGGGREELLSSSGMDGGLFCCRWK
jgi:hypothetical protein